MKNTKTMTIADMNNRYHMIGRIWLLFGVLFIVAVPIVLCLYFKTMPDWTVFASPAIIAPMIINLGAGFFEPVIYAPMIGINGEYLAFFTGNLSNLKIPCVVKAQEIVGTKIGTEENELVSTIAIATSTLVTALTIGIFVLCLAVIPGLQSTIAANKFLIPAFGCVVYALFGSLGGKYIAKNPKLAIIPSIGIVVISIILGALGKQIGSSSMFVGIALCIVFALFQFIREKRNMRAKEELKRLEAIAAGMSYEHILELDKSQLAEEKANLEATKAAKKLARKRNK
ncbi:MAG: hypothetical protein RSC44_02900 [Clostridia bacterium]